ncbi:MAG: SGNH/GDSL hydrolase family protein [Eubacteriales bacterium]
MNRKNHMILNIEQIKAITRGIVRIEEADGYLRLCRMSEEQEKYYAENTPFLHKAEASAGVRLAFRTTSKKISFDFRSFPGSSRVFSWFDLYINGALSRHFGWEGSEIASGHMDIDLGEGDKITELYFPWSRRTDIANVTFDDGTTPAPLFRRKTLLCFGDSITQGFDNLYPSRSYVSCLARLLGADEINKGVGGEKFCPEILDTDEDVCPDMVTVAYGTNDWAKLTRADFVRKCRAFCVQASEMYPKAKIFVVSPIWRIDECKTYEFGVPLKGVHEAMAECCNGLSNIVLIDGYPLVPHMKKFFRDLRVHPADEGSAFYAENLYAEIVKYMR